MSASLIMSAMSLVTPQGVASVDAASSAEDSAMAALFAGMMSGEADTGTAVNAEESVIPAAEADTAENLGTILAPLDPTMVMRIQPVEAISADTPAMQADLPREAQDGVSPQLSTPILSTYASPANSEPTAQSPSPSAPSAQDNSASLKLRAAEVLTAAQSADQNTDAALDSETAKPAEPVKQALAAAQDAAKTAQASAQNTDAANRAVQTAFQQSAAVAQARPTKDSNEVKLAEAQSAPQGHEPQTAVTPQPAKAEPAKSNAAAMQAETPSNAAVDTSAKSGTVEAVAAREDGKVATKPEGMAAPKADAPAAPPAQLDTPSADSQPVSLEPATPPEPPALQSSRLTASLNPLASLNTTAAMAAQLVQKLGQRVSRFDMVLTPETLGTVEVSMEVGSDGDLKARMVFDTPATANELRARAEELRRQLSEAGFQIGENALEFTDRESDQRGGFNSFLSDGRSGRRAFAGANSLAEAADVPAPVWTSVSLTPYGVDLKV